MFINRIFLCLFLLNSSALYASASSTATPSPLDELRDNILPHHLRRHIDFIKRIPQDNPDDRKGLSSRFIELSNVYVLKSKLLWTLSLKKSIFAFEWQNKQIEECLPDDWKLVRINQGTLIYSSGTPSYTSSSTDVPVNSIDLKRLSLTFSLIAYYYNNLALQRSDEEHVSPLLAKKGELTEAIQERALTPFGSWTIASHYAPLPIPSDVSPREKPYGSSIQGEVERFIQQYESLNVDTESVLDFLGELNFEVTNGIIFRATPEYGHHDFFRLELDTLFKQYKDLRDYWHSRLTPKESSDRVSPRGEPLLTERKIREIEDAQEQIERNNATKAIYQAFGFAFMTSDFLEMPIVYEKKLEAFMDPSKALHRDATLRTLRRVHTFFTRHQTLFIETFKERFEFFLMQIALLGAKKKTFSLPPYFHLIAKNYFLATPEYFDRAANHLHHIIAQLESTTSMTIATTNEQESKHRKKSVFSGLTNVFSKLTLSSSSGASEESSAHVRSTTNPVYAKHIKNDLPIKGSETPLSLAIMSSSSPSINGDNLGAQPLTKPDGFDSEKRRSSVPELSFKGIIPPKSTDPESIAPPFSRELVSSSELPRVTISRKISTSPSAPTSPRLAVHFSPTTPRNSTDSELSEPTSPRSSAEKSESSVKKLFRFNSFTRHHASKNKDSASPSTVMAPHTPREISSRDTIVAPHFLDLDETGLLKQESSQDTVDVAQDKPPSADPTEPNPGN